MIASDFSSALDAAFEAPDPREAVSRIKNVVAEELSQTDSRATVKKTDFFNHSFAPDLVISWPGESERFVFLKSDTRPEVLRDDVDAVRRHHPIVFALDRIESGTLMARKPHEREKQDDTLVADADGIEVLIRSRQSDPVVGLASSAVLQGGRGILTGPEAQEMAHSVSSGFTGAKHLDAQATGAAVAQISGHFDIRRTSRLLHFLSAVWVGSGGTPASFPGGRDVTGDLDGAALEFLLNLPPIEDYEFWRRIGRPLALESVSRLRMDRMTENLQYLVNSNLDVLHARVCRIVERQQELDEAPDEDFRWVLDREMLCLRGPRSSAYFAAKVDDLKVGSEEANGISLRELLRRADARRVPISELELATPTRTISYATIARDDVSHDEELMRLSTAFGSAPHVQSAVATLMGSRPLVCEFLTRTAKGRTTTKFPLGELSPVAMALLADLSVSEQSKLDDTMHFYLAERNDEAALFPLEKVSTSRLNLRKGESNWTPPEIEA
ncbi:hypothetical protein [Kitasatospora sp. NPDC005856]|uniref:hypothetical protein n=1 Tax=Kitasatospora sp. NPDC005856 TaxID=3154566 RepID=UPI00340BDF4C